MKKIYVAFLFLFLGTVIRAQTKPTAVEPLIRICAPSRASLLENQPLYVVNGIPTTNSQTMIGIHPNDVDSVTVLRNSDLAFMCSPISRNGALLIGLKKGIAFLPLNKVLRKVNKKDRALPVFLNDEKLVSREDFYLSANRIKAVKVVERPGNETNEHRIIQILLKQ